MFSRPAFRSAAPLRRGVRAYASGGSSGGSGGIGAFGWTAVAAGIAGGGYYYYANVLGKAPAVPTGGLDKKVPSPSAGGEPKKAFTGGDQGFIPLKLESSSDVNHNTKEFRFALPESDMISGLHVASAFVTQFQKEGDEKPTIRPYTPTSDENAKGYVDMLIKRYPDGPMSEHIHALKPGDTLQFKGPIPKYEVKSNQHNHIGMIAGGTGITPMYQVMRQLFDDPNDKTKVTLIFGNISEEDILLREEFNKLENNYPRRFRAFYVLDNPPEGWEQGKGYITKEMLQEMLPEPKEENIKVFVCGPPGLYGAVSGKKNSPTDQGELTGHLKELGYSQDQVFKF